MQQKTLGLARDIVNEAINIGFIENTITVSDSINSSSIRGVFKGDAAQLAFSVVRLLVDRFLTSFAFSTKHSSGQIDIITTDILDNFKYESLEDIIIFLKMARTGKFGTTHRGIDSNLIIGDWMPKYLEIKAIEREKQHVKEKQDRVKLEISQDVINKHHQAITSEKRHKDNENAFRDYVEKMTNGITREQLETLIEKCSLVEEVKPYMWILKMKRKVIK